MAEYIDKETTAYRLLKNGVKRKIVETAVLNVPANNVRENVEGKWVAYNAPFTDTLCCSVCGFNILPELEDYNFCPDCGADMRGEKDDN